jgi:hypothetical protein
LVIGYLTMHPILPLSSVWVIIHAVLGAVAQR